MTDKPRVLLIEDAISQANLYQQYLKNESIDLHHVSNGKAAKAFISNHLPELILLDLKLPDMNGQEILTWIQNKDIPCAVIIMTGHSTIEIAVEVMQLGAEDFLEKPFSASRLITTIKNQLEKNRLKHMVKDFQSTFERESYHGFIGSSLSMQAVYRIVEAASPSKATVFITGESGTGKEVCAEAIHNQSTRSKKPFVTINCGAIPHELMESEIFGHVKGAFSGAISERIGSASMADGGTLFLDEIGELDLDLQTKLLRFIQTNSFQKVGSSKLENVDIRFICATNRDPLKAVAAGHFREDLYYRLHVVPIHLPPLRDRGDDIISISQYFLSRYSKEEGKNFQTFNPETELIFRQYNWPGNVRQLQNIIRNIVVLHNSKSVSPSQLPAPLNVAILNNAEDTPTIQDTTSLIDDGAKTSATSLIKTLECVERETIEKAIALCDGNIPKAATLLDVSPSTIYRKKQNWKI